MKTLMSCVAFLAVLAAPAAAETRYDRKLEQAVMNIIAKKKIAEMRGGFTFDQKPEIVVVQDVMTTGSISVEIGLLGIKTSIFDMVSSMIRVETALNSAPRTPVAEKSAAQRRISRVITF